MYVTLTNPIHTLEVVLYISHTTITWASSVVVCGENNPGVPHYMGRVIFLFFAALIRSLYQVC